MAPSRFFLPLLLLVSLWLTGCASTLRSEISSFQRWPADAAGSTFSFKRMGSQTNSLEHASYEDLVRKEMRQLGLKEVVADNANTTPKKTSRFEVSLDYGIHSRIEKAQEPIWNDGYSLWHQPYLHPQLGWQPGFWSQQFINPVVVGYRTVNYRINTRKLRLDITEAGAKVFEASATSEGSNSALSVAMSYLVRSIFDGFPGTNGQVRTVEFDTETQQIKKRLVQLPG